MTTACNTSVTIQAPLLPKQSVNEAGSEREICEIISSQLTVVSRHYLERKDSTSRVCATSRLISMATDTISCEPKMTDVKPVKPYGFRGLRKVIHPSVGDMFRAKLSNPAHTSCMFKHASS